MEFVQKKHNLFVPCDVIESQKFLVFGYLLQNLIVFLVNWFDFLFTWHSGTRYNYETYSLFVLFWVFILNSVIIKISISLHNTIFLNVSCFKNIFPMLLSKINCVFDVKIAESSFFYLYNHLKNIQAIRNYCKVLCETWQIFSEFLVFWLTLNDTTLKWFRQFINRMLFVISHLYEIFWWYLIIAIAN